MRSWSHRAIDTQLGVHRHIEPQTHGAIDTSGSVDTSGRGHLRPWTPQAVTKDTSSHTLIVASMDSLLWQTLTTTPPPHPPPPQTHAPTPHASPHRRPPSPPHPALPPPHPTPHFCAPHCLPQCAVGVYLACLPLFVFSHDFFSFFRSVYIYS